jgi:XTP/dITP diphosphohydrolase
MQLVFATHNQNKYKEVRALIPKSIELLSLNDIGLFEEIPETGDTLQENALLKADFVTKKYKLDCFADDTGLLIDALNGEPGVYSARYAGVEKNNEANMQKVLAGLKGVANRKAHFKTVFALNFKGTSHLFEGVVQGEITYSKKGTKGFGYDPIFKPVGFDKTFAELALVEKNKISHRAKALEKLLGFLNAAI